MEQMLTRVFCWVCYLALFLVWERADYVGEGLADTQQIQTKQPPM